MIRATTTRRCLVVAGARAAGVCALLVAVPLTHAAAAGNAAVALAAGNDGRRLYRASADRLLHRSDDGERRCAKHFEKNGFEVDLISTTDMGSIKDKYGVPGMPVGAPEMPGTKSKPLNVYLLRSNPSPTVYASF